MIFLNIAICVILVTLILVLIISFYCFFYVFYLPKKAQGDDYRIPDGKQYKKHTDTIIQYTDNLSAMEYESVKIKSYDNLTLCGRYYHKGDDLPIAICFHGYRGTPLRDFCGGARFLMRENTNVLLVSQRAHCDSGGHTITFGVKEKKDCLSWVNYVVNRFGKQTKIILYGISMGAATVIMSLGENLPENVKGVVADCPYSSPENIIRKVGEEFKVPMRFFFPFIRLGALIFAHFVFDKKGTKEALQSSNIPVLIIHGEDDRFVPCAMSEEIRSFSPDTVSLEIIPNAGHALSYLEDEKRYEAVVKEFTDRCLKE